MDLATCAPGELLVLDDDEGRHAADVRRLSVGELAVLSDGTGGLARCRVSVVTRGRVELVVLAAERRWRPERRVVVVQALLKGDAAEAAVASMTEIGVDAILPFAAHRCVMRWDPERAGHKLSRWQAAARQAANQARRAYIPEVGPLVSLDDLVARLAASSGGAVIAHPDAPEPLTLVAARLARAAPACVHVVIGPEGGLTADEVARCAAAGAAAAHLGPTILRGSTAGTVAATVVLAALGRLDTQA